MAVIISQSRADAAALLRAFLQACFMALAARLQGWPISDRK
jgi:hypothetical protein